MLITVIFGWCKNSNIEEKISEQLKLSDDVISNLTLDHSSPHRILNDTDPLKYPELCICNANKENNETTDQLEYFGLKIFDGDDAQDNICLRPEDYVELSMNLFSLLAENNWVVHYSNGKPLLYVICTSVPNSKLK